MEDKLKYITTKDVTYKGKLFRGRKIIGTEKTLALIYPLIGKAIFTSGWRSKKEQEEILRKGASKTMDSNHRRGIAYDIWNWQEIEKEMKKLGFINDLKPWDPGHFPFGGENKARKNFPIIDSLPKNIEKYKPTNKSTTNPKIDVKFEPVTKQESKTTQYTTEVPKEAPASPQSVTGQPITQKEIVDNKILEEIKSTTPEYVKMEELPKQPELPLWKLILNFFVLWLKK